jgi:hypothetical protein
VPARIEPRHDACGVDEDDVRSVAAAVAEKRP